LRPHYHVLAPDLRGHGDSDWTRGGSYSLTEYVYDLSRLVRSTGASQATIVGHSMGGMVGLIYAGTFVDQVAALVVLDGVTVLPNAKRAPAHERIARWAGQLDTLEAREPRRYRTIEEAAAQMRAQNGRLPGELTQHLAAFGVRQNQDETYSWKFDPYQRAAGPHRLSPEDHVSLWSRITCPTLLLHAAESFLESPAAAAGHFREARVETISGAGHWLHHEKPDEVLRAVRTFLGLSDNGHRISGDPRASAITSFKRANAVDSSGAWSGLTSVMVKPRHCGRAASCFSTKAACSSLSPSQRRTFSAIGKSINERTSTSR
jgi:pimeloyl-ACP methyl ester carboxylesterase